MNLDKAPHDNHRQLVDWLETPAFVLGLPDTLLAVNAAFAALCAQTAAALENRSLADLLNNPDLPELARRLAQGTVAAPFAANLNIPGQPARPVLLRFLTLAENTLRLIGVSPIENDARRPLNDTDRVLLEYHAIMANAPVAIGFSRNRRIVRYNEKFAEIFGFAGDEGIGQPTTTLYPSEQAYEAVGQRAFPLLSTGQSFVEEIEMRRQNNTLFWTHSVAYLVDPADPPQGTIWIISDITQRRAEEARLRDTLLELQAIFTNASVGILFSRNRIIQRCNPRGAAIFGYTPDELVGIPANVIYPSLESYDQLGQAASAQLALGEAFQTQWQYRRKEGTLIWARVYARALDIEDTGRGTIWIVEDITEARSTEEALQQSLHEMEAIMANASVGILITRERRMIRHNQKFAEMFAYPGTSAIGHLARELYRSDDEYAEVGRLAGSRLSHAEPFQTELYMRRQDGSDLWINLIGYVADPQDTTRATFWILEDRSAFKSAEQALQQAYAEQQLILEHSVVGIAFIKNRIIQRCNRRCEEIYGYAPGELNGQTTLSTFTSEQAHADLGERAYAALSRGETFTAELIHRRRNGEPFWARATGKAIDPAHPQDGSIWNFEDITARKAAEESLRESEMLQRAILDSASLMIVSTDAQGRMVSCNPATQDMLGFSAAALLGNKPTDLFLSPDELLARREALIGQLGYSPADDIDVLLARVRLGFIDEGEWTFIRQDKKSFMVDLSISALHRGENGASGFLLVASDITERKNAEAALLRSRDELEVRVKERTVELEAEIGERQRAEERLLYLALHDPLTGLPNRNLLQQRLREAIRQNAAPQQQVAILFIDLDRFKTINDSLGHHIGDALLKKVAQRITGTLRSNDTVARIGGDEFVIIVPIDDSTENEGGEGRASRIAEKLLDALRPSFRIDRHELFITPSIGICLYPRDGDTVDTLMRNADTAMYQAKAAGRNAYCFFLPAMNAAADNYFQIESSLRRAVKRDEFVLHYQPITDLRQGQPAALEVLIRWNHPKHGLLPPGRFITVAEESGLIGQIGNQVLRSACLQLRRWFDAGYQPPRLAINLSPLQFRDPELIGSIVRVIDEFHLKPQHFELEITETALMQDGELTMDTLGQLHQLGFGLSIDDFGTGYSSLAYLKRFPVDTLKIDRSFIIDMTQDENDQAIVTAILALAHSLELTVVAEGVETQAQYNALKLLGCDTAQGYLISRPVSASEIAGRYFDASRLNRPAHP